MNKYPNILIISNNAISDTDNNGKTINFIFSDYPGMNIRQLYFKPKKPTGKKINDFFRITDNEMLDVFLNKKDQIENSHQNISTSKSVDQSQASIPKNNITRLAREVIWKVSNWKSQQLIDWLDEFSPDIIFFVAGDTSFAYEIALTIKKEYRTKLITYITDDYILPRKTINFLWWIRRNLVFDKMEKAISHSNLLLTISPKMKATYYDIFKRNSTVVSNMSNNLIPCNKKSKDRSYIKLIYAGGLHYNRYLVLEELGNAIKILNEQIYPLEKTAKLFIYTNEKPKANILDKININGASKYCGSLTQEELVLELNDSDILVHVESFDRESIESTKLSLSTKIGEYLSLSKPILAIGPENIASMEYLAPIAYCINSKNSIKDKLVELLYNKELQKKLVYDARYKYQSIIDNKNNYKIESMIKDL